MTILLKGEKVVTKLKCKGCTKHKLRKHFSNKWIEGAGSIRTSNIRDHINADQHVHVMEIEKQSQGPTILCLHFQFILKSYLCTLILWMA